MPLPSVGERPPRRWARVISRRTHVGRLLTAAILFYATIAAKMNGAATRTIAARGCFVTGTWRRAIHQNSVLLSKSMVLHVNAGNFRRCRAASHRLARTREQNGRRGVCRIAKEPP